MNIGLHDGLLDPKHISAMGTSVFLYLWCLRHQTKSNGLVLGGSPITYEKINERLGQSERTVRRWMKSLRDNGYVEVTYLNFKMMRLCVLKSKKFNFRQLPLPMHMNRPDVAGRADVLSAKSGRSVRPNVADTPAKNGRSKQSGKEKEIEPTPTPTPNLPNCIPLVEWAAYRLMRIKIHRPMTEHAVDLAIRKLLELKGEGHDPRDVLDQSVLNSWAGLFPIRGENKNGRGKSPGTETTQDHLDRLKRNAQILGVDHP